MSKNHRISAEYETQPDDLIKLDSGVRVNRKRLERRRRDRRMEASTQRLLDEISRRSADDDLDSEPTREIPIMSHAVPDEIPESRETARMAVPPFSEIIRGLDEPVPDRQTSNEVSVQDDIISITASSMEDAFRQLTGDPDARCPSDRDLDRQLGWDIFSSRPVELCTCKKLTESFRVRALYVLHSGAVILPPLVMDEVIDELALNPVNPIGFCIDCGKHMDQLVEAEILMTDPSLPTACCHGMQKAILAGRAELPVEKILNMKASFMMLRGKLLSADGEYSVKHDHCGWCGNWFQKFLIQTRLGRIDQERNLAVTA